MNQAELHLKVQAVLGTHHIIAEVLPCDPELADTAAFCEHYGFSMEDSANTILVASKKLEPQKFALCVVLATTRLDVNKKICELLGAKKASFADAEQTIEKTGMEIGGVTVFGAGDLPVFIDAAVMRRERVVMGGGNRSCKLLLDQNELLKLPHAEVVEDLAKPKEQ